MDTVEPSSTAPKMLIADDDPSVVRVLADRCTRMGFEVETASNGMQALLKAGRCKPDILLIDVNMPEIDGLSVCAQLLGPDRRPLHLVVVTGRQDTETVERCDSFGAFCTRKGVDFWSNLESALIEIFPALEKSIKRAGTRSSGINFRRLPRVLLVDDDEDVRDILSSRLKKCGVDILYASNATQGYRLACREEPTVVICDYFMPDGDAQYLLSRLRTNAATGNIPVIVLSGRRLTEVIEQELTREICGHPGAALILQKSLDTGELFEAVQRFCGFQQTATIQRHVAPLVTAAGG